MAVHVRLVTPATSTGFRTDASLEPYESPVLRISHSSIDMGPASIESEYEAMFAVPRMIQMIIEAENEGVDAVVIDCMLDVGLDGARECVTIPVLGPSMTAMHLAAMLGRHFSMATVLPSTVGPLEDLALRYGLKDRLASVRPIGIPVLELANNPDATVDGVVRVAQRMVVEDGADVIVLGCTGLMGLSTIVSERLQHNGFEVPVIDPVPAAFRLASALVEGKLSQSKLTWPRPPSKPMIGYPSVPVPQHASPVHGGPDADSP